MGCNRCSVLFIKLPPVFHPCLISHGPAVLNATSYIEIGIDALTGIVRGLIYLLIGITVVAPASLGARRAPVLA